MQPPSVKKLSLDDYPSAPPWLTQLFLQLNAALSGFSNVLAKNVTRGDNLQGTELVGYQFNTKAPASSSFPLQVKWTTPQAPRHVVCTHLERQDGAAITAPWSFTWSMQQSGLIGISFQGLADSTGYKISLTME